MIVRGGRVKAGPQLPRLERLLLGLALAAIATGCVNRANYLQPGAPRAAAPVPAPPSAQWRQPVRIVSFNIRESENIDSALVVLRSEPALAGVDILLLQEMDAAGTERIAAALEMGFVYYPAALREGRGFGNAVLSRWPIVEDEKLILPHLSIFGRMQRIATAVTVQIGSLPVRVYSVHLATPVNLWQRGRMDQMAAVLRDAAMYPRVILGGDLNSGRLPDMAVARGYEWPTEAGPRTVTFGRWDHILLKGFDLADGVAAGTIEDRRGASDHRPVWARAIVR